MPLLEKAREAPALEPLLGAGDVAELLGVARKTVYKLVDDGTLEVVRVRGSLRFEPAAVRQFVEAQRQRG